jgi:hypothetical protein
MAGNPCFGECAVLRCEHSCFQLAPCTVANGCCVVPRASPKSAEHSEFRVITMHAEPLRKSTHFLHQCTSPFTTLPSVLFYKEGLYIFTQHSSKHWCGSPFTGLPHHHLVRVGVNTSILILIVSILPYFLQASLIAYAIQQFELK